jgi:hypothetical protein
MKRALHIQYILCLVAAVLLSGCAGGMGGSTKVTMKQDSYTPGFRPSDVSRFKGKTVILDNFTNNASNTKSWGYFSADKKVYYEASVQLEIYLWHCFQKAFQHAGAKVLDQTHGGYEHPYHPYWWGAARPPQPARTAPRGALDFQFVLTSMTDQECKFQVSLFKEGETKFQKDYTVTMPPPASEDAKELEKNAYRLVDQMVITVFKDMDFQKSF